MSILCFYEFISTCLFNHVLIHRSLSYPLSQHDSQWSNSKCSVCTCSHGKVTCGPRDCPPLSCGKDQSPFIPDGDCCPVCAHNGGTVSCHFFFNGMLCCLRKWLLFSPNVSSFSQSVHSHYEKKNGAIVFKKLLSCRTHDITYLYHYHFTIY